MPFRDDPRKAAHADMCMLEQALHTLLHIIYSAVCMKRTPDFSTFILHKQQPAKAHHEMAMQSELCQRIGQLIVKALQN